MSEFTEFTHRFEVPAEPELLLAACELRLAPDGRMPAAFFNRLLEGVGSG